MRAEPVLSKQGNRGESSAEMDSIGVSLLNLEDIDRVCKPKGQRDSETAALCQLRDSGTAGESNRGATDVPKSGAKDWPGLVKRLMVPKMRAETELRRL